MQLARLLNTFGALALLSGCATLPTADHAALPQCAGGATSTVQSVETDKGAVPYRVCAGTLPIMDERGAKLADLFFTAYLAGRSGEARRPLTFVWNGGPGGDSRLLQFHALGPKVAKGAELVDNPVTPLEVSDLVFLDPSGTSFSRPVDAAAAKKLYSTVGDIAATASFVEAFRSAYRRESAPIYLVGESFGTWRAAGAAEALIDRGTDVAGIVLVSGGIPLGDDADRARMRALSLQNRTATAIALGKVAPELLSEAEAWSKEVWYPALRDPGALDARQRAEVVAGLSRFTGVPAAKIDAESLWMSPKAFRSTLLESEGKTLGIFDMRVPAPESYGQGAEEAVLRFYRATLGYTGGKYAGLESDPLPVGAQWKYDQAPITAESLARAIAGEGPPSPSQPWTLRALEKAPDMRVLVATGLYDSLNACVAMEDSIAALAPQLARRFVHRCYPGGHMMYSEPAEARKFGNDVSEFVSHRR